MNPFPNASKSFMAANPRFLLGLGQKDAATANVARPRRGVMNKTEDDFALQLEAMKLSGEILRYEFEGITLRWADMRYTPDFLVFGWTGDGTEKYNFFGYTGIKLIEVKGAHIWDRDIVRFKGARAHWPEFEFEMHQKTKKGWKRLH